MNTGSGCMARKTEKWLADIRESCFLIRQGCAGKSFEQYHGDWMIRSAVERRFEIIGEALNGLRRDDPATADRVPDTRKIIAFRNILVHGYFSVDQRLVWDVIQNELPKLLKTIDDLIEERGGTPPLFAPSPPNPA